MAEPTRRLIIAVTVVETSSYFALTEKLCAREELVMDLAVEADPRFTVREAVDAARKTVDREELRRKARRQAELTKQIEISRIAKRYEPVPVAQFDGSPALRRADPKVRE